MPTSIVAGQRTRKWQGYIWDSFDKAPEERRFLLKLDVFLFGFACLGQSHPLIGRGEVLIHLSGFFLKSLDQTNISNAFVSGMYGRFSDFGLVGINLAYQE